MCDEDEDGPLPIEARVGHAQVGVGQPGDGVAVAGVGAEARDGPVLSEDLERDETELRVEQLGEAALRHLPCLEAQGYTSGKPIDQKLRNGGDTSGDSTASSERRIRIILRTAERSLSAPGP